MTLPVANCGDCLYFGNGPHENLGYQGPLCLRGGPPGDAPGVSAGDWCGEFVHRNLGRQYSQDHDTNAAIEGGEPLTISFALKKQWRFPTEGE